MIVFLFYDYHLYLQNCQSRAHFWRLSAYKEFKKYFLFDVFHSLGLLHSENDVYRISRVGIFGDFGKFGDIGPAKKGINRPLLLRSWLNLFS